MFKIRYLLPVLLLFSATLSLTLPGCKPREEELQTSGGLEFSADTVKFDTVFTTLGTVSKRLWVYNRNSKAVNVDLVSLDNPASSPYTLLVNGDLKQTATNLFIRGQDSLLILVRAKLPDNNQNVAPKKFVVEEKLNFSTNGNQQHVLLRSFGQNIHLHQHVALPCNTVWTNDRPHVLYDTVLVPTGCTLRIKPGTRVYAHAGAVLLIQGTLLVNSPADFAPGTSTTDTISEKNANRVRFAGDRSGEAQYATAPGQWTGIQLYPSSQGNIIRYATIQNAAVAVLLLNSGNPVGTRPDVTIQNSIIRYISGGSVNFAGALSNKLGLPGAGILSIAGKATVENTLFTDCYEYAIAGYGGGSYDLNFVTIANYPASTTVRKTSSLTFTNVSPFVGATHNALTLNVRNSIVWGAIDDELYLENYHEYASTTAFRNSVLKTKLYASTADAGDNPGLANPAYANLLTDPLFLRPNTGSAASNNYTLKATSPARKRGPAVGSNNPTRDLVNLPRAATPSLGAYESTN
ncbi:MAG: hypothetical protein ACRYFX_14110 [Janthinobacterium lividum]